MPVQIKERVVLSGAPFFQCGLCMRLDRLYLAGRYESYVLVIDNKGKFLTPMNCDFTKVTDFSTRAVNANEFFSLA